MAELREAVLIEGQVRAVSVEFQNSVPTVRLELFQVPHPILVPDFRRFRPGDRIRAVCLGNSADEYVCVDYIWNDCERPITDAQRSEQARRLGIALVYEVPSGASCEPVISKVTEVELQLIKYLARHPERMREMHPDTFEKLVAEILASHGFDVEWTGRNSKTAADVIAFKADIESGLPNNFIVECKRHSAHRPVGLEIARALYGAKCEEGFANALLVTTSTFQDGVQKFALRRWDFHLRDFTGLVEWLNRYRPRPDGRLYMQDRKLVLRETPS